MGVNTKSRLLDIYNNTFSLINNFRASAKGWTIPQIPTLLGPLRICIYPRTFRSRSVKKATANSTHKQRIIAFIRSRYIKRKLLTYKKHHELFYLDILALQGTQNEVYILTYLMILQIKL